MTSELVLSILGVLLSALVAYHIAWRQGAFAHPRIQVTLGQKFSTEFKGASRIPWAIFIGIPAKAVDLMVAELPLYVECGSRAVHKVCIQVEYPKGRHAHSYLELRTAPSFADNEQSRFSSVGDRDIELHATDLLRPGTTTVYAELVAYRPDDLREATFDPASPLPTHSFRYAADKVMVSVSADNVPEFSQRYWLVAVTADSLEDLQRSANTIGAALLRKDGVPVRERPPGTSAFCPPWRAKRVYLVQLEFRSVEEGILWDHCANGSRQVSVNDFYPIVNSETPRLQLFGDAQLVRR